MHINLIPLEMKALKELRKDQNIVILPADKGRATIILGTRDYDNKFWTLLETKIPAKTRSWPHPYSADKDEYHPTISEKARKTASQSLFSPTQL